MTATTLPDVPDRMSLLRQRLGGLCHVIRFVSAAWAMWVLVEVVRKWSDKAGVATGYGRYLKLDLAGLPDTHYVLGFAIILADWALVALVVACVWRLFGNYLDGSIFTPEAATALRNLGWAGVAAVIGDIVARAGMMTVLSLHLEAGGRPFVPWFEPNDLLHMMMALFVVALAHVTRTGVEIADEHRQIV